MQHGRQPTLLVGREAHTVSKPQGYEHRVPALEVGRRVNIPKLPFHLGTLLQVFLPVLSLSPSLYGTGRDCAFIFCT